MKKYVYIFLLVLVLFMFGCGSSEKYKVEFIVDGEIISVQEVERGKEANKPNDPIKDGYLFASWDETFDNVLMDLKINAIFERINKNGFHTVTFMNWNGTILESQEVKKGEAAILPVVPEREGYEFVGWTEDINNIVSNVKVWPKYVLKDNNIQKTFSVKFYDANGKIFEEQIVEKGACAKEPDLPDKDGYKFLMWDKQFYNVQNDLNIYPLFVEKKDFYNITIYHGASFFIGENEVSNLNNIKKEFTLKEDEYLNNEDVMNLTLLSAEDSFKISGWRLDYSDNKNIKLYPEYEFDFTKGTSGLKYLYSMNGYYVTGYDSYNWDTTIVIPSYYNGLPVLGIHSNALKGVETCGNIIIEEGIKYIGDKAFKDCVNLNYISLPNSLEEIGEQSFSNCVNLKEIIIPENVVSIKDKAFSGCIHLVKAVIFSKKEAKISKNIFSSCETLSDVYNYNNFEFKYPNVLWLKEYKETNKKSQVINVDDYQVVWHDEKLYVINYIGEKKGNLAINIDQNEHIILPEYFEIDGKIINEYILYNTFCGKNNISIIKTSNGVKAIEGSKTFLSDSIKTIIISKNVLSIDGQSFYNCFYLEKIIFEYADGWYCETNNGERIDINDLSCSMDNVLLFNDRNYAKIIRDVLK